MTDHQRLNLQGRISRLQFSKEVLEGEISKLKSVGQKVPSRMYSDLAYLEVRIQTLERALANLDKWTAPNLSAPIPFSTAPTVTYAKENLPLSAQNYDSTFDR